MLRRLLPRPHYPNDGTRVTPTDSLFPPEIACKKLRAPMPKDIGGRCGVLDAAQALAEVVTKVFDNGMVGPCDRPGDSFYPLRQTLRTYREAYDCVYV